jgi:hypothetical protein
MFVAPVTVGDGVYTGAGTVVRRDVPSGALSVSGGPQRILAGWVESHRPGTAAAEAAARSKEAVKATEAAEAQEAVKATDAGDAKGAVKATDAGDAKEAVKATEAAETDAGSATGETVNGWAKAGQLKADPTAPEDSSGAE